MSSATACLEVLFTPADFSALSGRDLSEMTCVVFDVLRATSSMIAALHHGAQAVLPVMDIPEAVAMKRKDPALLLAGERDGVRIKADLTGSIEFDLGNSPREFVEEIVRGKNLVMTTTNGTRALRACAGAKRVLVAALLNLDATARELDRSGAEHLLIVCGGTYEEASYEDVLGAGALCELLWRRYERGRVSDAAHMARELFLLEKKDLEAAFAKSRNGRRLLSRPDLREDVALCAKQGTVPLVAEMGSDGWVRKA